ncbi:TPA: hypothetical protein ACK087_002736 [Staphylococcus aureus]|nr:hypothetical protein [Staphylococcus aureus]
MGKAEEFPWRLLVSVFIVFIVFVGFTVLLRFEGNQTNYRSFTEFKKETEVIEGIVIKAEKNSEVFLPDDYNLVVSNNKGISKMVKVEEYQYINYQKGSNVKFRIDKGKQNTVILDLKQENDITNQKEFKGNFERKSSSVILDMYFGSGAING